MSVAAGEYEGPVRRTKLTTKLLPKTCFALRCELTLRLCQNVSLYDSQRVYYSMNFCHHVGSHRLLGL